MSVTAGAIISFVKHFNNFIRGLSSLTPHFSAPPLLRQKITNIENFNPLQFNDVTGVVTITTNESESEIQQFKGEWKGNERTQESSFSYRRKKSSIAVALSFFPETKFVNSARI
jgi:hypothetical protein